MATFPNFETTGRIDPASIEACRRLPGFPPAILDAWSEHGEGFVNPEGMLRLVDPARYSGLLGAWLDGAEGAVCFAATGLGDLFLWRAGRIFWVVFRTGHIQALDAPAERLLAVWENPAYLDEIVWRRRYLEAVARMGRPNIDEAFYYAPFLLLGGQDDVDHMDRGTLVVTLDLFASFFGQASLDSATGL